jgi:hypothetical protein
MCIRRHLNAHRAVTSLPNAECTPLQATTKFAASLLLSFRSTNAATSVMTRRSIVRRGGGIQVDNLTT